MNIEERTIQLRAVYNKHFKMPAPKTDTVKIPAFDRSVLDIGLEKDPLLRNYWQGIRPNRNESSDDQGFMNKLAFWAQGDEHIVRAAFLNSPYYAKKSTQQKQKCQRTDYLTQTIRKSIDALTAVATRPTGSNKNGVVYLESFHDAIRPLEDTDRLTMYDTIFDFGIYGILPDNLPPHLRGYFSLIRPVIESSKNRYVAAVENGKKGGRPPKENQS